jgi:ubiquitin-protein ligase
VTAPRVRRLMADAELLATEFAGHPHITVEPVGFAPAEEYIVTYRLQGVHLPHGSSQPQPANAFRARIKLTAAYPREKPYCTMESPIFHPNFGPRPGDEICIGDYWTTSQTLVDIVAKIGEMVQYQTYNVKSPLNAVAARWVAENEHTPGLFPIGRVQLFQSEPEIALRPAAASNDAT